MSELLSYCRLCLRKRDDQVELFQSIRGMKSFQRILREVYTIKLDALDGLPTTACQQCIRMIQESEAFNQIIRKTQNDFEQLLEEDTMKEMVETMEEEEKTVAEEERSMDYLPAKTMEYEKEASIEEVREENVGHDSEKEKQHNSGLRQTTVKQTTSWILGENGRRYYPCEICGKALKAANLLRNHLKTHQEIRKPEFYCEICGKGFDIKSQLAVHKYVHREQKSKKCEYCGKFYFNIWEHIKVKHQGKDQGRCTICNKDYARLRIHIRKMHQNQKKMFTCNICGKSFSNQKDLSRHIGTHVGLKVKCLFCVHEATDQQNSIAHMKRKHPVEYGEHQKKKEEESPFNRQRVKPAQ